MSEWLIKQGNTSIQDILIKDRDGNAVTNLADAQYIKFQVKENLDDDIPKISKSKGDGIEVLTDDDLGKLRITILPTDTTNLSCKTYFMGLEIKWNDNTIYEINLSFNGQETNRFRIIEDIIE